MVVRRRMSKTTTYRTSTKKTLIRILVAPTILKTKTTSQQMEGVLSADHSDSV